MASTPRYPYVVVDVAEAEADDVGALLFELGARGVEYRDATTLIRAANAPIASVTLLASFETHDEARAAIDELPAAWSPRLEEVVGDAWRDEWKKHFEPFRICKGLVVRPPWRSLEPAAGEALIVLEPGRAFGTGLHETTGLVAEVLADRATRLRGAPVLDVGCGSGVLALVALRLGASLARAVDIDAEAVAVTRENAERNALSDRVHADETPVGALRESYPVVVANIEYATLAELAPALHARTAPGGLLVLSGLLAPHVAPAQLEGIRERYATFVEEEVRVKGEWMSVAWVRR
jgi:ribosomal protein L11 methyltransferase